MHLAGTRTGPLGIVVAHLRIGRIEEYTGAHALGIQGARFEPIRNLLPGGHQRSRRGLTEFSTAAGRSLHQYISDGTPRIRRFSLSFPSILAIRLVFPLRFNKAAKSKLIFSVGVSDRPIELSDSDPLGIKIGIAVAR
jgi:hypothetical protein